MNNLRHTGDRVGNAGTPDSPSSNGGGGGGNGGLLAAAAHQPQFSPYMQQPPPMAPYYMQSPAYPMLMNPPPMPTYSYGVPPTPYAAGMVPMMGHPRQQHQPGLRRAGSINAKMMSAVNTSFFEHEIKSHRTCIS